MKLPLRIVNQSWDFPGASQTFDGWAMAQDVSGSILRLRFESRDDVYDPEFIARIVASVNACAGVSLEALEAGIASDVLKEAGLSQ